MDPAVVKRRLTCILAADAVGYSRQVSDDEGTALRVLAAHRAVIDGIIAFHDGRIFNTAGDSVLAEFASAVEAVRAAIEIQDALRTRNESLPEAERMPFRIGINLGDVVVKNGDLLGDGVNVAARLEGIAPPGGILIASSVYDQITGKLDLGFQDIGEQDLKNISRPIRAFSVSGAGGTIRPLPTPSRALAARRLGPFAIVAIVALGVGALLAITQGWLRPAPPEPRVDPAQARLERELEAARQARLDAESRAASASADASRARLEIEAANLRSKAEVDAAATKAKAQAEAATLRAQAQSDVQRARTDEALRAKNAENDRAKALEAERAKAAEAERARTADAERAKAAEAERAKAAEAERERAAETERARALEADWAKAAEAERTRRSQEAPAKVAAAPAASSAASRDGNWVMSQQCSANQFSPGFSREAEFFARDGEFVIERGAKGQPGYNITRGRPSADGTLLLVGTGIGNQGRGTGQPFEIRLDGRWNGDRYVLRGTWGGRLCDVTVVRR